MDNALVCKTRMRLIFLVRSVVSQETGCDFFLLMLFYKGGNLPSIASDRGPDLYPRQMVFTTATASLSSGKGHTAGSYATARI
jgi:hypothetical protein